MQIKTTVGCSLTFTRMAVIKATRGECRQGVGKGNPRIACDEIKVDVPQTAEKENHMIQPPASGYAASKGRKPACSGSDTITALLPQADEQIRKMCNIQSIILT